MAGWLAALLAGGPAASWAAPTLATLTPPTQWQLLEFRLEGLPVAENPFDPDRFSVSATFRTPSGKRFDVPGFWYQDFTRRLAQNAESLSPNGTPEWRLRFLPTESGPHEARVFVRTNGATVGAPVTLSFEVAATNATAQAGYVRIAANHRYFQTEHGAPLPLIGHCVCWHGRRGTYDYDAWFAAMQQAGENYTRLWMAPWAFGLETEPDSRLNYDLRRAWQLDYVLRLAEQRGLYLMLCFDYHGMFEVRPDFWGGNNFWPRHPYNAANGGPCARQNDFFTNAEAKRLYQKRLRYLIARYGYSPNLLAWQFFNEIDNVYRHLNAADVAAWHAEMGAWLKQNDPWKHLVTTSLTGGSDRAEIWRLPELDFAMYHSYALPQPAAALPGIVHSFLDRYQKPVMIGEFGTDWRGWRREQDPWLRGWRQGLWAGALSGAVGTSMSWWWESIHAENLYPAYRALRDFMHRTRWGQGAWEPLAFQTNDDPPAQVGDAKSGGPPFTATLRLDGTWGAKPRGQLAVADALSATLAPRFLNSFVHGASHADLRVPLRLHLWGGANARLTLHVNSVSSGAVMAVSSDGRLLWQQSLPDRDGGSQVNHEYNEDFTVPLPEGRQWIEVRNAGQDWFYLDWLRVENALPAEYADGWRPSPIALGLRGEHESLLYVVSPHVNYPANATNRVVATWRGGSVRLKNFPRGRYRATWFDPQTNAEMGNTTGESDGALLDLPLPDFTEDLAGQLVPEKSVSLRAPQYTPEGRFRCAVHGDASAAYLIETSHDRARRQGGSVVARRDELEVFEDPTNAAEPSRFHPARRVPAW